MTIPTAYDATNKKPEAKIPMKNTEPSCTLVVIDNFCKVGGGVPIKQRDGEEAKF